MAWLEDMARGGVVSGVEGYLVGGVAEVDGGVGGEIEADVEVAGGVGDADVKGKGKEKDVDVRMVDITNSKPNKTPS
jgi:hypothetical protein